MKFTHEKRLPQNKLHLIIVNCFETVPIKLMKYLVYNKLTIRLVYK